MRSRRRVDSETGMILTACVMLNFDMFHFLSLAGSDRLLRSESICLNDAGVGSVAKVRGTFLSWHNMSETYLKYV